MANGVIDTRKELLRELAVACELEQGLCLQYLFAAFSLKDSFAEGGIHTMEQLNLVRKWKANIFLIGAQEMLHLTQAANLCSAAGGTVQLRRPNFPQSKHYYPTKLPWRLDAFSEEVISRFAWYERPADPSKVPFDYDKLYRGRYKDENVKDSFEHLPKAYEKQLPRSVPHATIGELYEAIAKGFETVPNVMIGNPDAQVEAELVDFPQLITVESASDARRAIEMIVSQGEGTKADPIDSHCGVFLDIREEYMKLKRQDLQFDPVRKVASNPLSRLHVDNVKLGYRLIDDPFTIAVNDLCSEVYTTMMLLLYRFFATTSESPAELRTMSQTFLRIMTGIIKPLGEALTKLPMGDPKHNENAGPSFEITREIQLLPHKESAWIYIHERLLESAETASKLAEQAGDKPAREDLRNANITLQALAKMFGAQLPTARR